MDESAGEAAAIAMSAAKQREGRRFRRRILGQKPATVMMVMTTTTTTTRTTMMMTVVMTMMTMMTMAMMMRMRRVDSCAQSRSTSVDVLVLMSW